MRASKTPRPTVPPSKRCKHCGTVLGKRHRVCCSSPDCKRKHAKEYKPAYKKKIGYKACPSHSYREFIYPNKCKCPGCHATSTRNLYYPQPTHRDGTPITQWIYCASCDYRRDRSEDGYGNFVGRTIIHKPLSI